MMGYLGKRGLAVGLILVVVGCASEAHDANPVASDFALAFSPIYTAYTGESDFRVPVIALDDVKVERWEIVDASGEPRPDVADIQVGQLPGGYQGAMLTTQNSGDYYVLAHAGDRTGCAELHITAATEADRETGFYRFTNAIELPDPSEGEAALPRDVSCKNCHSDDDAAKSYAYTPEQLAGFSNGELGAVLTNGVLPPELADASHSRCKTAARTLVRRADADELASFHHWKLSDEELTGVVVYMRSIVPGDTPAKFARLRPAP